MDSDGVVVDNAREPDVSDEEVLKWYTNMLTGMSAWEEKPREEIANAKGAIPASQSA